MRRRRGGAGALAAALAVALASMLVGSSPASAATVTVPCTGVPSADGAALLAAVNAHANGDTVVLVAGCNYQLAGTGFNAITDTFTMQGNGATISSSADLGSGSVFSEGNNASNLTINGVTFSNLSCSNCDGPAIETFANAPTLTVTNSTFTGNTGGDGGAVATESPGGGNATIIGSTFVNNTARFDGGAIHNVQTLTVINSTFTGNTAPDGGAFFADGGAATFINDTIAGNTSTTAGSGAFDNRIGTATVKDTIISNNSGGNCGTTAFTDDGFNLENGTSCNFASHAVNADPALGTLASNGGPTQTMAITTASPAFEAGSLAVCSAATPAGAGGVDQRGLSRAPFGAETACEIGAFEVQPAPTALLVTPRFTG